MNKYILFSVFAFSLQVLYGQNNNKLSLDDAIELCLTHNPELIEARGNVIAARGRYFQEISLPQPEIELSLEFTPAGQSLSNYSERTFALSQSFEFPSTYFIRGSKYSIEEDIALQHCRLKEKEITAKLKTVYYKVLSKQLLVKYADENLSLSEDFFKKAQIRYNVGEVTNLEQLTARVQFSEAKNKLAATVNELETSITELNYMLGYGGGKFVSDYQLTDSLVYSLYNLSLDNILYTASVSSPRIKIAELYSSIASADKTIAWSSLLPNFNFAYFRQSRDGDNGFYGASFGVSVPLWFLFDQRGRIEEADANKSAAEARLAQVNNEIALISRNAFTDYNNSSIQLKSYIEDILPQAEEVYRTAAKIYDAGELSYLEYVQAKQLLLNARENYTAALFNYNKSVAALEEITGKSLNLMENLNHE